MRSSVDGSARPRIGAPVSLLVDVDLVAPRRYGESAMDTGIVRSRRWTRVEYARLMDCGLLREGDPVELVGGHLVVKEPQYTSHATAARLVVRALEAVFAAGWDVRAGLPIALAPDSEPEPDVSVVRGGPRDYLEEHPARPVLVVEVAFSSLAFDRRYRGSLYARAGLPDYWIMNLVDGRLEVNREPVPDPRAEHGWSYQTVIVLGPRDLIAPLAAPQSSVRVADLLP
jgi:Uma2 family endonuclease